MLSDMVRVRGKMRVIYAAQMPQAPQPNTSTLILYRPHLNGLIINGPLTLSPAYWRAGNGRILMSRWTCLLFHIHRRSVLLEFRTLFPSSDFCYLETIASMFCKSCNCNSSIATRIGFAVRPCHNDPFRPFSYPITDDIRAELHACLAHEDSIHDRTY